MTISATPESPQLSTTRLAQPTALYRYFDAQDVLLYVGIARDLAGRESGHIRSSVWMQVTARSTVERYPDRPEALEAERLAIEAEHPIFNLQYNDSPEARERRNAYISQSPVGEIIAEKRREEDERMAPAARSEEVSAPQPPPVRAPEPAGSLYDMEVQLSAGDGLPIIMDVDDGTNAAQIYLDHGLAQAMSEALSWFAQIAARPIPPQPSPQTTVTFGQRAPARIGRCPECWRTTDGPDQ